MSRVSPSIVRSEARLHEATDHLENWRGPRGRSIICSLTLEMICDAVVHDEEEDDDGK